MLAQGGEQPGWQDCDAVLRTLAAADGHQAPLQVQVLHAQPQALDEAQARAIEQAGKKPDGALHLGQDLADLFRWGFLARCTSCSHGISVPSTSR